MPTGYEHIDADAVHMFATAIDHSASLRNTLELRLPKYVPHAPTPKQRAFLLLPHREAFFGGAAGGGKSDALLMAALQYVDVPRYSAIIFRQNITDAELSGAILNRAKEWLGPWLDSKEVVLRNNAFHFPSPDPKLPGAMIQFAYMANQGDCYRYQSAEFQFIGFDELTHFAENDYRYLLTRLRRPKCPLHLGRIIQHPETGEGISAPIPSSPTCPTCRQYAPLTSVPLRMRSASNPPHDNRGMWVKKRFQIKMAISGHDPATGVPIPRKYPNGKQMYVGHHPKRPFIPSLAMDNPYVDFSEYKESLSGADPVTREQLLAGDWSVSADGRFRKSWARYYSIGHALDAETGLPEHIILGRGRQGTPIRIDRCFCFQVIDPAASSREGPGDEKIYTNRMPSWTVISTFLLTPSYDLLWWDIRRFQGEAPEIISAMRKSYKRHRPSFVGMEFSSLSKHLYSLLKRSGFPMKPFNPGVNDKLARAVDACNRMEQGKVWLPEFAPWLDDLESELFTWVGHPYEQADQIDTLAYAAMYVSSRAGADIKNHVARYASPDYVDNSTPEVFDMT